MDDTPREWLEVSGPSVDVAVAAALKELGLDSPDQVSVDVIQEGKRGVLGLGGREAIVKVSPVPARRRRRRRRRRSGSGGEEAGDTGDQNQQGRQQQSQGQRGGGGNRGGNRGGQNQRSGSGGRSQGQRNGGGGQQGRQDSKASNSGRDQAKQRNDRSAGGSSDRSRGKNGRSGNAGRENTTKEEAMSTADISEQAEVAKEFLEGLLNAFGLDGTVTTNVEEEILYLDVSGEQTEALVGNRGSIMTSVLEITRTVVQRKTFGAPRMRLDIAGYAERRRTALTIYAGKLADQVKEEGNEVMLEPMNPADRKVVHDAVGEIDGVRSFSEGEDPNRAVVIAPD